MLQALRKMSNQEQIIHMAHKLSPCNYNKYSTIEQYITYSTWYSDHVKALKGAADGIIQKIPEEEEKHGDNSAIKCQSCAQWYVTKSTKMDLTCTNPNNMCTSLSLLVRPTSMYDDQWNGNRHMDRQDGSLISVELNSNPIR